jgi:DNA-binding NtrC family response regulator
MSDSSLLDGKKILIVDDEPDVLEVLEELLSMCEVVKASTFEDAKELLEAQDFDMAILDIMGVNGYALLDIARQKQVTAVMLTAHALTPDNVVRSIREGAASYIPKDEITNIAVFLIDIFKAQEEGKSTWAPWQERLPSSYFERKWGAAWQDTDKEFWERFRVSLRSRQSRSKNND